MSADVAIAAKRVSKSFRFFDSPVQRLREALVGQATGGGQFHALIDVSLEVPRGCTVGIIGRNGSGKSTLLQILCGILQPTGGEVVVNGSLSAILDLGAGFNPELSGRDNVFLRGYTLGLGHREMAARMDAIEDFAEIGEFFERPVKTYSAGMFLRLAFAAAVNVDPEVLVIDEMLAVGDARFQHKCFLKIQDFQRAGKTILLVTHNMDAVVRHCQVAYLLDGGSVVHHGEPREVVSAYMELLFTGRTSAYVASPTLVEAGFHGFNLVHYRNVYHALAVALGPVNLATLDANALAALEARGQAFSAASLEGLKNAVSRVVGSPSGSVAGAPERPAHERAVTQFLASDAEVDQCGRRRTYNPRERRFGDRRGQIIDYLVVSEDTADPIQITSGERVSLYIKARFTEPVPTPMFGFSLKSKEGVVVHASNTRYANLPLAAAAPGEVVVFRFSLALPLHAGDYFFDLGLAELRPESDEPIDIRSGAVHLVVRARSRFDGLVDLDGLGEEVARRVPGIGQVAGVKLPS